MAGYTELELKTFDLSSRDSDLSLSVTSLALLSDLPPSQQSSEELCDLIQSNELWLVSPGICRIQIIVHQNKLPILPDGAETGFLEHLADAICQCSVGQPSDSKFSCLHESHQLWPSLGLTIKQEDIQYQPLYDGAPNLYFIVEHPEKSSILLSPTHTPTARFNGIECLLCYNSETPEAYGADSERAGIRDKTVHAYRPEAVSGLDALNPINTYKDEMSDEYWDNLITDVPINQAQQRWDDAGYLAQTALQVTIGAKERIRGLRVLHLDSRPSLLQLAPAIWNAHYLEAVTFHVANFPIISNIIATASRSRSPTLRRKSLKLFVDDDQESTGADIDINAHRDAIHKRLWDLVQTGLEPTIGTKNTNKNLSSQWSETTSEGFDFTPMKLEGLDEYESGQIDMDNRHIGFGDALDDSWPSYQYAGYEHEIQDNDIKSDSAAEHEQWWDENEDVEFTDEDLLTEDIDAVKDEDEDTNPPEFSLYASSSDWYSSYTEDMDETPPDEQDFSESFNHHIMDLVGLQEAGHLYNVDTIYIATNEVPFSPQYEPLDEEQQMVVHREGSRLRGSEELMDENNWSNEHVEYQDVEIYE
ncbi:hypothetical protein F5Y05DRAFT_420046 [Hypoxylon sp. FL0543]|nr:hypothetical protein F5Y05DRAFT_420046 [Hypoxylon sp. FL0543]